MALHGLVHLAEGRDLQRTSRELADCVGTNPVVIRRTFGHLRNAGILKSVPGAAGGWSLTRSPDQISLGDVHRALGERLLVAVDLAAPTGCRLQAAVTSVMDGVLDDAETLLLERLDRMSLTDFIGRAVPRDHSDHTGRGEGRR